MNLLHNVDMGVNMAEIICLLFPALFSVYILERLISKKLSLRNFVFVFVTNTILINVIGFFLMFCLSSNASMTITDVNGIHVHFSLLYILISTVAALGVAFVERFYFDRFRIYVIDDKDAEAKDAHKNNEGASK